MRAAVLASRPETNARSRPRGRAVAPTPSRRADRTVTRHRRRPRPSGDVLTFAVARARSRRPWMKRGLAGVPETSASRDCMTTISEPLSATASATMCPACASAVSTWLRSDLAALRDASRVAHADPRPGGPGPRLETGPSASVPSAAAPVGDVLACAVTRADLGDLQTKRSFSLSHQGLALAITSSSSGQPRTSDDLRTINDHRTRNDHRTSDQLCIGRPAPYPRRRPHPRRPLCQRRRPRQ